MHKSPIEHPIAQDRSGPLVVGFLCVVYLALDMVLGSPCSLPLVALAGAALVWASATDLRALRIPDGAVVVVAVSGVAALVLEYAGALWLHITVAASVGAALVGAVGSLLSLARL